MTPYEECWDLLHGWLHKQKKRVSQSQIDSYDYKEAMIIMFDLTINQMSDIENEILGEMKDE